MWIRTLLYLVLAVGSSGLTTAQTRSENLTVQSTFDIPAQPLGAALKQLADQAGLQILFEERVVQGINAPEVRGRQTVSQVLQKLLDHTGLEYVAKNQAIAVRSKSESEGNGRAPKPAEGAKTNRTSDTHRLQDAQPTQADTSEQLDRPGATPRNPSSAAEGGPERSQARERIQVEEVVVTGSRIKRAQVEGPAPVTVITREQMEREGFTTPYEALYSLTQSTGSKLEGQFFPNGATSNATTVDLRGLGPGRTLVLFNGRRAADYPLPFDGKSNIVNLSAIPTAALERIEILSGGASAIYGSDAVSGVINFVMRDHFDGIALDARVGRLYDGGGNSQRVDLTGGLNGSAFKAVYALEYFHRQPVFALDNKFFGSLADDRSGLGRPADAVAGLVSFTQFSFIQATEASCAQFGPGVHVVDAKASLNSFIGGPVCAGPTGEAQHTIRNETQDKSGFFNSTYDFSDALHAFGTFSVWQSNSGNTPQLPVWSGPNPGLAADVGPNAFGGFDLIAPQRFFQLSEATRDPTQNFSELAWDTAIGLKGGLFEQKYDWELAYHHSGYTAKRDNLQLLEQSVDNFFLGPQMGTVPFAGFDLPLYAVPDYNRFVQPLTTAQFRSITAFNHTKADSSNDQVSAVLNGNLFNLPAGPIKFSGLLEWGTQQYQIHLDPREVAGDFTGITTSFPGGGSRKRYAAGAEFAAPLLDTLRLTLAGRYDRYDDVTNVKGAFTYNAGLEYRPVKSLLLRSSYATSFRAPDMQFVFAGASNFFSAPLDVLQCRRDQHVTDLTQCSTGLVLSVPSHRQGNHALSQETGRSWTTGVVWSPVSAINLSVDYFNIRLDNIVDDLSTDYILRTEADCKLGQTIGGQPVNGNSGLCQFVDGLVTRNVPTPLLGLTDSLKSISVLPINRALQSVNGLDAALNYELDVSRLGKFFYTLGWSHVLKEDRQEFAADPVQSYRDDPTNLDLRSKIRSAVTWQIGGLSQTLFLDWQGSRPTFAAANSATPPAHTRTGSYSVYNYTASYAPARANWKVSLIVDNLFNADPRIDPTFSSYPFFYGSNVNPYGREVFLEAGYAFK